MGADLDPPKRRKRKHGEGSVYRRKDGRWIGALMVEGKRKEVSGKTAAEATQNLNRLKADLNRGLPMIRGGKTVAQFLEEWLETVVKVNNRPRTYDNYAYLVRRHIIPAIGKHRLEKLTQQHVQVMLNEKAQSGLSGSTVANMRRVLRVALNQAMRWDLVARNVVTLTNPPPTKRFEGYALSAEEIGRLLDVTRDDRLGAMYAVVLSVGLRQGEVLGLRWQNLDLEAGTLTVDKQLQYLNGRPQLTDPKTKRSRRTLVLPPAVIRRLRQHKRAQLEERLLAGGRWRGEEWNLVFCTTIGTPLDSSNFRKAWHSARQRAGLPDRVRFHDLRGTALTHLAARGVHPRTLMEIAGHSQISTTMEVYTHTSLETIREATDLLDVLFDADKASS